MPINMRRCITHGIVKHETIQVCALCVEDAKAPAPTDSEAEKTILELSRRFIDENTIGMREREAIEWFSKWVHNKGSERCH